jgi:hypothetical protein
MFARRAAGTGTIAGALLPSPLQVSSAQDAVEPDPCRIVARAPLTFWWADRMTGAADPPQDIRFTGVHDGHLKSSA